MEIESDYVRDAYNEYLELRKTVHAGKDKPMTLMDLATIGAKALKKKGLLKDLDESEEINACSVKIKVDVDGEEQDWLLQFKNETHNHPTEIEPFGGAATCLGGAIRDPLSGRAYIYQAMRVTGAGDPLTPFEQTIQGKLPQKKIVTTAAAGYSSYGNQIGLATGQVSEAIPPGLCGQAHGGRRSHRCGAGRPRCPRGAAAGRRHHPAGRQDRPRRLRRRGPVPPSPTTCSPFPAAARRSRRATRRRRERFSACSATAK